MSSTPKMRKLYDGKLMSVPKPLLNEAPNCCNPVELTHSSTSAPRSTPQTLPMPPSTTIASRMIELANWKLSGMTPLVRVAYATPPRPPIAAPTA